MNEPAAPAAQADADLITHLAQALGYSVQHRNVIQQWLHRHLPDHWPAEKLDESGFYEHLRASVEDPASAAALWAALSGLADKKPKWALNVVPLEPRLIKRSYSFSREKGDDDLMACREELPEGATIGFDELGSYWECLAEQGYPQFAVAANWLMAHAPFANPEAARRHGETPGDESPAEVWRHIWQDVADLAGEALDKSPDREMVQELLEAAESLDPVVSAHEAEIRQDARDGITGLLERIKNEGSPELATQAQSALDSLDANVLSGLDAGVWCGEGKACLEALVNTRRELDETGLHIQDALSRQDFGQVGALSDKAEGLKAEASARTEELVRHIGQLWSADAVAGAPAGITDAPTSSVPAPEQPAMEPTPAAPEVVQGPGSGEPQTEGTSANEGPGSNERGVEPPGPTGDGQDAPEGAATPGGTAAGTEPGTDESDVAPETPLSPEPPVRDFSVDASVEYLVDQIRNEPEDEALPFVNGLVWRLLLDDRAGLAAHIADSARAAYGEGSCAIPPELLHAVALAEHLGSSTGEAALRLRDLLTALFALGFDARPMRKQKLLSLYGIAATLRPALVAPDTTAAHELLESIHLDDLRALHQLSKTLLEHRHSGIGQNPAFLRTAREYGEWQDQVSEANKEANDWWVSNRHKTFKYSHATRVWHHWLEPDQPLGRMMILITDQDPKAVEEVGALVDQWSKHSEIESQIQQADDILRGRKAQLRPIEGSAKQDLIRHVRDPLDLGRNWLDLMAANPGTVEDSVTRKARELRDRIQSIAPNCIEELLELSRRLPDSLQTAAAVHVATKAVKGFLRVLREGPGESRFSPLHHASAELLHLPEPPTTDDWAPAEPIGLDALLDVTLKGDGDWAETLSSHGRQCRHHVTERVLAYLEARRLDGLDLDTLDREREATLERCRAKLDDRVGAVRNRIERAVAGDELPEAERLGMIERLEAADNPNALDLSANLDVLAAIEADIDHRREDHVREIRTRLEASGIGKRQPAVAARIEKLLSNGDTLTANEYIALAETGQDLPEDDSSRDAFAGFFPEHVSQLNRFLSERSQVRKAMEAVRSGQNIGPIQMAGVPGTQATEAVKMLEAWLLLKEGQGDTQRNLNELLRRMGFQVESINVASDRPKRPLWFDLRVQPLKDREICPIPRYGSLAQGHYRLLCVGKEVTEDEILALTNPHGRDVPTIVLYLGRMTETRRRDLAHLCLERRRTVLVVDETLVYYLCTERGLRLGVMFQCTFPFTTDNPYTIASSNVPVEMFFGRQQELDSLVDPFGSNLVYGGRQLGKTALLREIERRHDQREAGFIVRWIDLKAEGIGLSRPSSDLWEVIASALVADQVVKNTVSRRETVSAQIAEWLEADHHRRILLLLDEADAFLYEDSRDKERGYATIAYLKDLMDRTHRRFKIVLAGLHNVQRSARDVNTPIAHMGQPVCIGPLLENGEVRAAMNLVNLPFRTLGFRLKGDVASRILSHTNYYPSLIQIFCRHLLDVLNETFRQPGYRGITPPYEITAQHIEEAYQRKELRNAIAERFRFTLELDGRYRIIALRIALETLERRAEGGDTATGYDVDWLRNETLQLWPKGFPDSSFETFRTLLDEMIGLGILRRAGPEGNRYALRSPNVISLLGTQDEIMEALLDASDKEPPLVYEAATYRRFLAGDPWHRSPLTGEQESRILASEHGVTVLFGMPIAGLHRAHDFLLPLKDTLSTVEVIGLPILSELRELESALEQAINDQAGDRDGVVLLMINPETPWTESWVQSVARMMRGRRTKRVHYRILFSGDPAAAWRWVTMSEGVRKELDALPLSTLALQPWRSDALRRWMEDASFGPINDPDERSLFTDVTGNWSEMLHALGDRIRPNLSLWADTVTDFGANPERRWSDELALPVDKLHVLRTLHDLGEPATPEELAGLLDQPIESLRPIVEWADLLNILQARGRNRWQIDPMVGRLIDRYGA